MTTRAHDDDSKLSVSTDASPEVPGPEVMAQAVRGLISRVDALIDDIAGDAAPRWRVVEAELHVLGDELEEQKQEVEDALARVRDDQLAFFQGVAGSSALATLSTDSEGTVREADLAAEQLLGLRGRVLAGKPLVVYVAGGSRGTVRSALTRAVRTGSVVNFEAVMAPRNRPVERCHIAVMPNPRTASGDVSLFRWILVPASSLPTPDAAAMAAMAQLGTLSVARGGLTEALGDLACLVHVGVRTVDGVRVELDATVTGGEPLVVEAGDAWAGPDSPTVDAARDHGEVVSAIDGDVASVLSLPVTDGDAVQGVLTVWSRRSAHLAAAPAVRELMPYLETVESLIGDAQAITHMRQAQAQLQEALVSRAVIDQAKGMIMVATGCDADAAFDHLVRMSSRTNVKLREVAASLVADATAKARNGGGAVRPRR